MIPRTRLSAGLSLLVLVLLLTPVVRAAEPPLDASTRDFDMLHLDLSIEPDIEKGLVPFRRHMSRSSSTRLAQPPKDYRDACCNTTTSLA